MNMSEYALFLIPMGWALAFLALLVGKIIGDKIDENEKRNGKRKD